MTKLKELRADFQAATPGEWELADDPIDIISGVSFVATTLQPDLGVGTGQDYVNARFIALAHNLMPALLEAVDALYAAKEVLDEMVIPECMYGMTIDDPDHPWSEHAQQVLATLAKLEEVK